MCPVPVACVKIMAFHNNDITGLTLKPLSSTLLYTCTHIHT